MSTNPIQFTNREQEAEDYLEKHKIHELFANITSHLVFKKPDDPKESIVEYLDKLRKSKLANLTPPTLFEEPNLQSMFGMLDPSGRGFITYNQYCEALKTLGIKEFEKNPDGKNDDRIRMDTFLREAKKGLNKINATFKPK